MGIKILHLRSPFVSDRPVEDVLNGSGLNYDLFIATDKATFLVSLHSFIPDVILCDDEFPPLSPLDPIVILKELKLTTPLIVVNCSPLADFALRAINIMKHGAYDYLTKDNIEELPEAIKAVVEKHKTIRIANAESNLNAVESLKRSEASLRTIVNNTDMAIVLIDSENKIVQFNTLAEKFAKEQYGLIIKKGDSVLDHVSEGRRDHLLSALAKVKNGELVNYQLNREVNGIEKWFDIGWTGIKNYDEEDFGYIFTTKDITEKKKLEIEREKITADLIQRNKDLEQFTYIISHNLRAPVANIIGLSVLLNELRATQHEYSDTIEGIAVSANKLDGVILDLNQILQVSRSNEKVEEVSLTGLIHDIQASINHLIEKENVKIGCDFVNGDSIFTLKSYLYSIFYNLISNSIKYRKLGVAPVINITSKTDGSTINIVYQDNGRGIDLVKNAKNLFGLYKRFDTSVEGKGMGLFMVKMQVESLEGTIALQSKLNEGTSFVLEFPVSRSYEAPIL